MKRLVVGLNALLLLVGCTPMTGPSVDQQILATEQAICAQHGMTSGPELVDCMYKLDQMSRNSVAVPVILPAPVLQPWQPLSPQLRCVTNPNAGGSTTTECW